MLELTGNFEHCPDRSYILSSWANYRMKAVAFLSLLEISSKSNVELLAQLEFTSRLVK